MHRITARIFNVSNEFQNKNVPIHKRFCFSPPPYYLDWFERYYLNINLNRDDGPFYLQCINGIQGKKLAVLQWNILLGAVVTVCCT